MATSLPEAARDDYGVPAPQYDFGLQSQTALDPGIVERIDLLVSVFVPDNHNTHFVWLDGHTACKTQRLQNIELAVRAILSWFFDMPEYVDSVPCNLSNRGRDHRVGDEPLDAFGQRLPNLRRAMFRRLDKSDQWKGKRTAWQCRHFPYLTLFLSFTRISREHLLDLSGNQVLRFVWMRQTGEEVPPPNYAEPGGRPLPYRAAMKTIGNAAR